MMRRKIDRPLIICNPEHVSYGAKGDIVGNIISTLCGKLQISFKY